MKLLSMIVRLLAGEPVGASACKFHPSCSQYASDAVAKYGVVRGSGIFGKGWGADRARTYGIPEDKLGEFYAQRTLLKREVLPEHVAAAVFALVGGDLSQTTGLHIPVDAGVAAAFLR